MKKCILVYALIPVFLNANTAPTTLKVSDIPAMLTNHQNQSNFFFSRMPNAFLPKELEQEIRTYYEPFLKLVTPPSSQTQEFFQKIIWEHITKYYSLLHIAVQYEYCATKRNPIITQKKPQSTKTFDLENLYDDSHSSSSIFPVKLTMADIFNSEIWQNYLKFTIAQQYNKEHTFLGQLFQDEEKIFKYLPHFELNYYDPQFVQLRNGSEITRLYLILSESIRTHLCNISTEWSSLYKKIQAINRNDPTTHNTFFSLSNELLKNIQTFEQDEFYVNVQHFNSIEPARLQQIALQGVVDPRTGALEEGLLLNQMFPNIEDVKNNAPGSSTLYDFSHYFIIKNNEPTVKDEWKLFFTITKNPDETYKFYFTGLGAAIFTQSANAQDTGFPNGKIIYTPRKVNEYTVHVARFATNNFYKNLFNGNPPEPTLGFFYFLAATTPKYIQTDLISLFSNENLDRTFDIIKNNMKQFPLFPSVINYQPDSQEILKKINIIYENLKQTPEQGQAGIPQCGCPHWLRRIGNGFVHLGHEIEHAGEALGNDLYHTLKSFGEEIKDAAEKTWDAMKQAAYVIKDETLSLYYSTAILPFLFSGGKVSFSEALKDASEYQRAASEAATHMMKDLTAVVNDVVKAATIEVQLASCILARIPFFGSDLSGFINAGVNMFISLASDYVDTFIEIETEVFILTVDAIQALATIVQDCIVGAATGNWGAMAQEWSGFGNDIASALLAGLSLVMDAVGSVLKGVMLMFTYLMNFITDAIMVICAAVYMLTYGIAEMIITGDPMAMTDAFGDSYSKISKYKMIISAAVGVAVLIAATFLTGGADAEFTTPLMAADLAEIATAGAETAEAAVEVTEVASTVARTTEEAAQVAEEAASSARAAEQAGEDGAKAAEEVSEDGTQATEDAGEDGTQATEDAGENGTQAGEKGAKVGKQVLKDTGKRVYTVKSVAMGSLGVLNTVMNVTMATLGMVGAVQDNLMSLQKQEDEDKFIARYIHYVESNYVVSESILGNRALESFIQYKNVKDNSERTLLFNKNAMNMQINNAISNAAYDNQAYLETLSTYNTLLYAAPTSGINTYPYDSSVAIQADVGQLYGLSTSHLDLSPSTGFSIYNQGRNTFSQEGLVDPLIIPTSKKKIEQSTSLNKKESFETAWYQQKDVIFAPSSTALKADIVWRVTTSRETPFKIGIYLSERAIDLKKVQELHANYRNFFADPSISYDDMKKSWKVFDTHNKYLLNIDDLAKIFVLERTPIIGQTIDANNICHLGLYTVNSQKYPDNWAPSQFKDVNFKRGTWYRMKASLQGDTCKVAFWEIGNDSAYNALMEKPTDTIPQDAQQASFSVEQAVYDKKILDIAPTLKDFSGTIGFVMSGAAVEYTMITPSTPITSTSMRNQEYKNLISNTYNNAPALEKDREIAWQKSIQQTLTPTFGSYKLKAIDDMNMISNMFLYNNTNVTPPDVVTFFNRTANGGYLLNQNPSEQTQGIVSLATGLAYDESGTLIAVVAHAKNMYEQQYKNLDATLSARITTLQKAFITSLQHPIKLGNNRLTFVQVNDTSTYIYQGAAEFNTSVSDFFVTAHMGPQGITEHGLPFITNNPHNNINALISIVSGSVYKLSSSSNTPVTQLTDSILPTLQLIDSKQHYDVSFAYSTYLTSNPAYTLAQGAYKKYQNTLSTETLFIKTATSALHIAATTVSTTQTQASLAAINNPTVSQTASQAAQSVTTTAAQLQSTLILYQSALTANNVQQINTLLATAQKQLNTLNLAITQAQTAGQNAQTASQTIKTFATITPPVSTTLSNSTPSASFNSTLSTSTPSTCVSANNPFSSNDNSDGDDDSDSDGGDDSSDDGIGD